MTTSDVLAGASLDSMVLKCVTCGRTHALDELRWRCGDCRGVLDLEGFTAVMANASALARRRPSLWRYAEALPVPEPAGITMGEGGTPLVPAPAKRGVFLKMDYLMPTGSFKDRGAVLVAALAERLGVRRMVADSSGNAGAAIAAYAARAGIVCDVYVPATTSAGKVAQLRAYGATVRQVDGTREDTAAAAALDADDPDVFYASHVYNPFFFHGTKTYVFELWEQFDGRLPGTLVLPAGNGTLVLGAYLGCRELLDQRLIDGLPRIVAVQAENCAPLAHAFNRGRAVSQAGAAGGTIAEGIAIARPARAEQIVAAVRATQGEIVTVAEPHIRAAHSALARAGLHVEPTAAVCWAAIQAFPERPAEAGDEIVAPLCGSGLKSKPPA
ncbi:pyridoxal-phosphate dependent enzyme [Actinomadura rubrisoli]|uniref:Pyridoxal-phosphate dependent enzyme n=2 Tax=Actinomadura rubrisoli TaxID=2530368 RepID=A0A4R5BYB0_9ACTN|nr:pyridoxal-phosphate dependent enzyme [Actinomadura rubrisoli]